MNYGVFKKGDYHCLVVFETKEEAEECIKGKESFLEVRKIIKTSD